MVEAPYLCWSQAQTKLLFPQGSPGGELSPPPPPSWVGPRTSCTKSEARLPCSGDRCPGSLGSSEACVNCPHPSPAATGPGQAQLSDGTAPHSHAGPLRYDVWQQHPQGLPGGTGEEKPHAMKTL